MNCCFDFARRNVMRKGILLTAIVVLSVPALLKAQPDKSGLFEPTTDKIGVTLDFTYVSKWLSKGVEAYGSQGGLFKTLDIDIYGTGFGIKTTHRNATGSGFVDSQRFDFRPYYKNTAFEGETYATIYNISVGYEYYPGLARNRSNTTFEWIFSFSWPNILPGKLVPGYKAHYEYGAGRSYKNQSGANIPSGWVHRFLLGYDLDTEQLPNPLHLSSEVAYTDGLGGASHDWSYITFGLSTVFEMTENLSFVPGFYHQISMDDSVAERDDITYCVLRLRYKF